MSRLAVRSGEVQFQVRGNPFRCHFANITMQCKQHVRAAAAQAVSPPGWVPQAGHSLTAMTHPWLRDFPTVTYSVHYILEVGSRETGLNHLLSVAISVTVEFSWQKQISEQVSHCSPVFPASQNLGRAWSPRQSPDWTLS